NAELRGCGGDLICGLYDVTPTKFGLVQNLLSEAPAAAGNQSEVYNGVDFVVNVRLRKGININGGINTGRTELNNCGVVLNNPQFTFPTFNGNYVATSGNATPTGPTGPRTNAFCDVVPPWGASTQGKFSG